jgi:thiol-disulfide isomerase/thioredoxin
MVFRRVLVLLSAFLATTSAFQVNVNPRYASPHPSQLGYRPNADVPESAYKPPLHENVKHLAYPPQPTQLTPSENQIPNMFELSTRKQFKEHVKDQKEKMTIVRFHAPFCRACKAMQPAWERLARENPNINFINVEYNKQNVETRALISQLRINKVPFGQVYHPSAGLVESANFNKKHFSNVVKHIEWYVQEQCGLPGDVDEFSGVFESPYAALAV